jgi:hypothetical protein
VHHQSALLLDWLEALPDPVVPKDLYVVYVVRE